MQPFRPSLAVYYDPIGKFGIGCRSVVSFLSPHPHSITPSEADYGSTILIVKLTGSSSLDSILCESSFLALETVKVSVLNKTSTFLALKTAVFSYDSGAKMVHM